MMGTPEPLVSVVTPVHNGEKYIADCIERVLRQSYHNWEHVIVNNASTDRTREIASTYAASDARIKIYETEVLLPHLQNFNRAMKHMSDESKYCKVVHADDWVFPDCLSKMVELGEKNPTVGIIGAYCLWESEVKCDGLPYPSTVMPGREIARSTLMEETNTFLSPSCLMIRSDLVRSRVPFYNETRMQADIEVCYELLKSCDFGFVHQVLTFIRRHEDSVTATVDRPWNKSIQWNLDLLLRYGPVFLSEEEHHQQVENHLTRYYRFLAENLLKKRDREFWEFHERGLADLGCPLRKRRLWLTGLWLWMNRVFGSIGTRIRRAAS